MTEVEKTESVICCEGYHDRAHWQGWLLHLGCLEHRSDPFGDLVRGGQYGYRSVAGSFIRVIPCGTKDNVRPVAKNRLEQRIRKPLSTLVINVDADTNADGTPTLSTTINRQSMMDLVRGFDQNMIVAVDGALLIDGGATTINLIRWETNDPPIDGLPNQQTLERVVCASIAAAYPDRAPHVHQWLSNRSDPPSPSAKEYAWSNMAGWYPEQGCDAFYGLLWDDKPVADQLEVRLRESGAWDIAEALAK